MGPFPSDFQVESFEPMGHTQTPRSITANALACLEDDHALDRNEYKDEGFVIDSCFYTLSAAHLIQWPLGVHATTQDFVFPSILDYHVLHHGHFNDDKAAPVKSVRMMPSSLQVG
jgi:hypothetical protein